MNKNRNESNAELGAQSAVSNPHSAISNPHSNVEILIVEDSPVEAEMLRRALVKAGYRVTLAQNGEEGLQALRERPRALVMSDIQMPLMNGYQLCNEIKHDDMLRNIPVILLTALSEPEDIIEAIKVGADSYITKPFVEDIMLEHIRSLLNTPIDRVHTQERQAERIEYNGKQHFITANNQQMLNLLLSVYRNTIAQNRELMNVRVQLNQLNDSLDQKVQERTAALQESERRIRTILDTALDAFISMDNSGLVTGWNVEAERLFGYSREDALGESLAELIIPPAYRDAHGRGLKHFIKTGKGPFVGGRAEVTAMRNDRSEFPAELSITIVRQERDTFFSAFMRDITERKQAESKISFLAYHDQLTELPNRELFYDRLSQAISQARRKHERLALLFLDLDGFKAVNDNYGHEAGDIVLKAVAMRLQACVRGVDTVARLGGDEFTIILSEMEKPTDVSSVAEKIIQKLTEPVFLYGTHKCDVGVSIGISIYPEDGYELDKLLSAADSAMYESKAIGNSSYTFFKEKMGEQSNSQSWIVLDAEHLLGVPEIDLHHQEMADRINSLNDAVKNYASAEVAVRLFDDMITYTRSQFEAEERLMDQHEYFDGEAHKQAHQRLLGEANYLRRQFIQGGESLVLQYIKDWLLPHILDMDKPFASYLIQRGAKHNQ
jgi:diguanylate cyclase (GGDEF)-like protein/PAS domain S-box-containing protein/hemerythrin-like metal-binding protein